MIREKKKESVQFKVMVNFINQQLPNEYLAANFQILSSLFKWPVSNRSHK
jgi:hypothetical protein